MRLIVDTTLLLQANDYRSFLLAFYSSNKKQNPQFSYSYLAKKCNFSAKSFIKDVIDGKKNLTHESTAKILSGLSLPQAWKLYLENLIKIDLAPTDSEKISIKKNLETLKKKLIQKKSLEVNEKAGTYFFDKNWPPVYAALGSLEKGASLEQVVKRTRLPAIEVEKTLNFLLDNQLVFKADDRYLALQNEAFFSDLGSSNFFQNYFLKSALTTADRAQKKFKSDENLFFSMSVSVNSKKMPQFKHELAELLDKFSLSIEDPEGDRVAELICGFSV